MSKYAEVALRAIDLVLSNSVPPKEAWERTAIEIFPDSKSSREKGCPKGTFLGLCASGLVVGIPVQDLGRSGSGKNAQYGIAAVKLLCNDPALAENGKELWEQVLRKCREQSGKAQNSQLDVVLALYKRGVLDCL